MTWQKDLAKTRQPRLSPLHIPPSVHCICNHPRSSHTAAVFSGKCHVVSANATPEQLATWGNPCQCLAFDAWCGCGHLLSAHAWGTPPEPWACSVCICRGFGAKADM